MAVEDTEYDDGESVALGFGILPSGVTVGDPEIATVTINDNKYVPSAVQQEWLTRFGRTAAAHVVDALNERIRWLAEPPRCPPDRRPDETSPDRDPRWRCRPREEARSVVIGGQRLDSGAAPADAMGRARVDWSGDRLTWDGGTTENRETGAFRNLTARELLAGSSFYKSASEEEDKLRLSFWGRGAFTRFDGRDGDLTLDGDVATATLGADYAGNGWLAGVALSHSEGEGAFSLDDTGGKLASSLTGIYPYLRYGVNERLSVWGMGGYGAGTLTLTVDGTEPIEADIAMTMEAVGARGELLSPAEAEDFSLTLKADALFLQTVSDGIPGLGETEADVSRLRLGLEGSFEIVSEDGVWLSPFLEAGLRYDGGDAETGFGMEVGGGLRYTHLELDLTMELNARGLLTHAQAGFAEWGVSGSLRYDPYPSSELGPSLTLSPSWGPTSSGRAEALWASETMANLAADDRTPGGRLDAQLSYGFAALGGKGIKTPWGRGLTVGERERFPARLPVRLHPV